MSQYKIKSNTLTGKPVFLRAIDNTWIPEDENNIDYQDYLKWISEGNTPEEWVENASE